MRILHIGKYFPPDPGGMEVFLADLVGAQRAAGDEHSEQPETRVSRWCTVRLDPTILNG